MKHIDSLSTRADGLDSRDTPGETLGRVAAQRSGGRAASQIFDFDTRFSQRILIRLVLLAIVAVGLIVVSLRFIIDLYFENQLTGIGFLINGAILALFLFGMARLVITLVRYAREERAVGRFIGALEAEDENPAYHVDSRALIAQRYRAILRLTDHNVPVNHSALAGTLLAAENTRLSFPRFVNNVLILAGVFGTIVALSIALIGASDLFGGESLENISLIIHGMSTALSTTITAIVCFFFFTYSFIKTNDAKTHLLSSGIEQLTALYLLPRYSFTRETVLFEVAELVLGLREAAERMQAVQSGYAEAGEALARNMAALGARLTHVDEDVRRIKHLLQEGFRLPPADD